LLTELDATVRLPSALWHREIKLANHFRDGPVT
jgi:hypothetical protein